MKTIFVITNVNGTYDDVYSFGLATIASVARDKKWDYDCFVVNSLEDYDSLLDAIERISPQVVAYTAVSSQFMYVKDISAQVKKRYGDNIIQICGGVHATLFPQSIMEAAGLNAIFMGESEEAFSDFLECVSNQTSYTDVKNIAYNVNGELIKNSLYALNVNLDTLPFPEREKFQYHRFIQKRGHATFMFSRGCPYLCSYCSNHAIAKTYGKIANKPRYRTASNCIKEIQEVRRKYKINKVFICDDTFGVDLKWMRDFCTLYDQKVKLPFGCQLRVNLVNDELMKYLKLAGCVHVSCGVESGNEYIRNIVMKRNISTKQIIGAYKLFKKYGITSNAINIVGVPGETAEQVWDTIKLNRKINPKSSGVNIFYPYRGTKLGDYCFEQGLVDENIWSNFSSERRDSVLKLDPEFKKKLIYLHKNWDSLVYRFHPWKLIRLRLVKFIINRMPRVLRVLRFVKRNLFGLAKFYKFRNISQRGVVGR